MNATRNTETLQLPRLWPEGLTKLSVVYVPLIFYGNRSAVYSFPKSYCVRANVNRRRRERPPETALATRADTELIPHLRRSSNYACFSAPASKWYSFNDLSVYFQREKWKKTRKRTKGIRDGSFDLLNRMYRTYYIVFMHICNFARARHAEKWFNAKKNRNAL